MRRHREGMNPSAIVALDCAVNSSKRQRSGGNGLRDWGASDASRPSSLSRRLSMRYNILSPDRFVEEIEGETFSVRKVFIGVMALHLPLVAAMAQQAAPALSLDQQNRISELITNQTPQPLTGVNFSVAPDVVVPSNVTLQRLPAEAEKLAPQLQGDSYLAVEELVAIVDTSSRKIVTVMQRMRRQERTKAVQ
jgi:hypothetical protein